MLCFSERVFDIEGALDEGYSCTEIKEYMEKNPNLVGENKSYDELCSNTDMFGFPIKECEYKLEDECVSEEAYFNNIKQMCAHRSGFAKSDYAAKQIYENCLKVNGIPK